MEPSPASKFMSKFYTSSGMLYRYELLFGDRRALLTALLDKSDKIAQLQMVTLPSPTPSNR